MQPLSLAIAVQDHKVNVQFLVFCMLFCLVDDMLSKRWCLGILTCV